MKRLLLLLGCAMGMAVGAHAQELEHVQVGIYGDYFHLSQTSTNFAGVGARLGKGVFPHVKIEGEMAYDFNQVITQNITNGSGTIVLQESNMHLLHGEFGPKLELGHGRVRPFLVAKAGFDKFFLQACPATFNCFSSAIHNLHVNTVSPLFYPGGGLEGRIGPVGLRLDVGDEMYFNSGTHNNFRMAFGPFMKF